MDADDNVGRCHPFSFGNGWARLIEPLRKRLEIPDFVAGRGVERNRRQEDVDTHATVLDAAEAMLAQRIHRRGGRQFAPEVLQQPHTCRWLVGGEKQRQIHVHRASRRGLIAQCDRAPERVFLVARVQRCCQLPGHGGCVKLLAGHGHVS
jgi:hypothetical protein